MIRRSMFFEASGIRGSDILDPVGGLYYDSLQIEIPLSISCREMALVSKKVSMLQ